MKPNQFATALVALALWPAGLGAARAWPVADGTPEQTAKIVTVLRDEDCAGRPSPGSRSSPPSWVWTSRSWK